MDGLTVRKLFVDSRLRQPGGTSSEFVIELPEYVEFPPGTHVVCSEALIPTSFNTIDDKSNRLYLSETRRERHPSDTSSSSRSPTTASHCDWRYRTR